MIWIEVRCDKCGTVGLSRAGCPAHVMRHELVALGWKHFEMGGKDFCRKHWPRKKHRGRKRTKMRLVNEKKNERSG